MKKIWIAVLASVMAGCSAGPSMKTADFTVPEIWQAGAVVSDLSAKTGRIIFMNEEGITGSVSMDDLVLADAEHPLPEDAENIWIVPGFDIKEIKPAKKLYRLGRIGTEAKVLNTNPSNFTAAGTKAVYFAHTDGGTPSIAVLDRLDLETMEKTSLELEDRIVQALSAGENGVCMLTDSHGTDLKASFYDSSLSLTSEVTLLADTVGNVFYTIDETYMAVTVFHMEGETPYRTLFIINPDTGSVITQEMSFSRDGRPVAQDSDHILIVESMEREDVLLTRYEMSTYSFSEYTIPVSFAALAADMNRIYLIAREGIVHVLDGKDPSAEISRFSLGTEGNETVRNAFARN